MEIVTVEEPCTYYFGEFETKQEAEMAKHGYMEDLLAEGHHNMLVQIRLCLPENLTVWQQELSGEELFPDRPGMEEMRIAS